MSYEEAAEIARKSECVEGGDLKETHMCNEFTGTWWIDLDIEKPGCNPACVVWVVGKTAEINWRCTGVIATETVGVAPTEEPTEVAATVLASPTRVPETATPVPLSALGKIAFFSIREYREGHPEIYLMDADGSNVRRLSKGDTLIVGYAPALSPDGGYIAYARAGDVYVVDADGSNPRNLTNNEEREVGEDRKVIGFDSSPTWSPDGRYIAFQSDREGESQEIYVMEADGSNPRRLTEMGAVQPSWSGRRRLEVVKQPVADWVGTIVKLPHGSQFGGYFERDDGQRYGIDAVEPGVKRQIDEYRWTGAQVRVSGELMINVPAVEGRQIQVERIEAISGPTTEARNLALYATPSASSSLPADREGSYHSWSAIDGLLTSCWAEGVKGSGVGEWIMLTFPGVVEVQRIGLDVGFDKDSTLFAANNRVKKATIRFSTGESVELEFADSRGIQVREIALVQTTFIRIVIDGVYPGSKYDDKSVAEIEIWGTAK